MQLSWLSNSERPALILALFTLWVCEREENLELLYYTEKDPKI